MRSDPSFQEAWPRARVRSGIAGIVFVLGALVASWSNSGGARAAQGKAAHVQLPRFESLKSDRVTLRNGPGREFPISWVLTRAGLPVEVVREVEGWKQVRDADGTTGWVPAALLSARRTAVVQARSAKPHASDSLVALRQAASEDASERARLEKGMLVAVASCDGSWCQVAVDDVKGHVPQRHLWGVYPGERLR